MGQHVYPVYFVSLFGNVPDSFADLSGASPDKKWCHEDASNMMFDALLEENGLELHVDDAKFIKALIIGDRSMCRYSVP